MSYPPYQGNGATGGYQNNDNYYYSAPQGNNSAGVDLPPPNYPPDASGFSRAQQQPPPQDANYAHYYNYPNTGPQQPPPQGGYTGGNPNGNGAAGAGNPLNGQGPAAPAGIPSYYDYTVPQSYDEVENFKGSNEWATSMVSAPCAEPCMCIASFFCPCCCTFLQRRKLLVGDWSRYVCCGGIFGSCGCTCSCGQCGFCCLCLEVSFCLGCAVHGNRHMVRSHYRLTDDCCDIVIMWSACVLRIVANCIGSDIIRSLADCWYYVVLSCMLAQQEHQMRVYPYPKTNQMV